MEGLIIYIVIAVVAVFNFIKNYQKEQKKNKKRAEDILSQPIPVPINRPFQKKDINETLVDVTNNVDSNPSLRNFDNLSSKEIDTFTMDKSDIIFQVKNDNLYNSKDIEAILAKIENSSNADEKEAFFVETKLSSFSDINESSNKSFDLKLETAEDYRRAFVHTLIFDRKY